MLNLLPALLCVPLANAPQDNAVQEWLRSEAVALEAKDALGRFSASLPDVRVFGLGEATHGQHECFEFKRELTLHLIRERGYRLVAYEADATGARALNEYVQGRADDLGEAMNGFGMMIWHIEENRALLEDLRAWNEAAEGADRVEIIGIDVQDPKSAARRVHELLRLARPELAKEAKAVADELVSARDKAYTRDLSAVAPARERAGALVKSLSLIHHDLARSASLYLADEVVRCAREIARFPVDPTKRGARDRGMGESLLEALAARGDETKAVLWGHNGHITKGPLRWMGTEETGAGGHLRAALGEKYYALGVSFGSGGFQALDQDAEDKWMFRRYRHGPAPEETVGHALLAAKLGDSLINFRRAPSEGPVRTWLDGDSGMRSWGGHRVPADPDAAVEEGQGLAWTILSVDYDGLLFLKETTSAKPVDQERIWK